MRTQLNSRRSVFEKDAMLDQLGEKMKQLCGDKVKQITGEQSSSSDGEKQVKQTEVKLDLKVAVNETE